MDDDQIKKGHEENFPLKYILPLTQEQQVAIYNATHVDSQIYLTTSPPCTNFSKMKYTKAIFSIDAGNSEEHIGYHTGELWNGWGNPSFEKDVAEKVVKEFNQVADEYGDPCDRFEWEGDALVQIQDGERYRVEPYIIDFEGRKVTVYPIGNNQYCWWIEQCEMCDGTGKRSYSAKYQNGDLYSDGETLQCDVCDGTGYKKP